ncbi:MAG: hypothetical protein B6D64_07710 [Bacteroidetes bacterium 4484_276]|nr:MAG: hypothetical protein B6D64_07710 [Bacteroidetes bacterium 4484_276]
MAAVVFVGGRRLRNEAHAPPTKTSRHETTTNGKPGLAAQNKKSAISNRHKTINRKKYLFLFANNKLEII